MATDVSKDYLSGKMPETQMEMGKLDAPLEALGFTLETASGERVSGRLQVTERCCQPFKVLHGGVSALIAEALASIGAHIASKFERIAGIELNINHLKPAALGEYVFAEATPLVVGKRIQVWEVKLWKIPETIFTSKIDSSTFPAKSIMAASRVTILSGMPVPKSASNAAQALKKFAKL